MSAVFEDLRPLLFSIAYRMLGRVAEAEDIVQEAFLRYPRALVEEQTEIDSPKAYLSAVTTRLAIDHLRSARVRKETYVGEWLPEPLLPDVERAVFLLHDVFDYGYDEVARIVDKSEENTRRLAVRARRHVDENRPRFEASRENHPPAADLRPRPRSAAAARDGQARTRDRCDDPPDGGERTAGRDG